MNDDVRLGLAGYMGQTEMWRMCATWSSLSANCLLQKTATVFTVSQVV